MNLVGYFPFICKLIFGKNEKKKSGLELEEHTRENNFERQLLTRNFLLCTA